MLAGRRLGGVGDRGQRLVIDLNKLGGVPGLGQRLGDDEGDGLADIAHPRLREAEMGAPEHRRAVRPLAAERHPHHAEPGRGEIVAGVDRQDAGRGLCRGQIDRADRGMGMRRAQHCRIGLAGQAHVVLKAAVAA